MERRKFLKNLSPHPIRRPDNDVFVGNERKITAGLEERVEPLTWEESAHLLKRLTFGPKPQEIESLVGLTPKQAMDKLLGDGLDFLPENEDRLPDPSTSLNWIDDPIQNPSTTGTIQLRNKQENILKGRYAGLIEYLISLMRDEDVSNKVLVEKPTLFLMSIWNIEFTYDARGFLPPNLLWRNNNTLRKYRMGSYIDIAKEMTLDGAFLLYQSLQLSSKGAPNENFARELMELFTMGIGNYTEGDIQEASRILTGWRTSHFSDTPNPNGYFESYFSPNDHDIESKQVMGVAFPARTQAYNNENKVKEEEVHKLVDTLFERRPQQIAKFIMEKLYRFFVYSNQGSNDNGIIEELATYFVDNDFNLREAYMKLFTSEHFFEEANLGVQIKMPIELIVGLERKLGVQYSGAQGAISTLEQTLYDPPNVSGWKFYRAYISTKTYPARVLHAKTIVGGQSAANYMALAKSLPNNTDSSEFLKTLTRYVFSKTPNDERLAHYWDILRNGGITSVNWRDKIEQEDSQLADNLKTLFESFVYSPDMQLT